MPAESEEGLEERTLAKVLKGLDQPTAAEIEQHEAQSTCLTEGGVRSVSGAEGSDSNTEGWLTQKRSGLAGVTEDSDKITMVVLYDSKTRSTGAVALPGKGGDNHATDSVVEFLQLLGHRRP
eukprot:3868614-Amphidinium_carterae.2